MKRIVITGGAGFIGSFVAESIAARFPEAAILILDKMTYAADIRNIGHILGPRVRLVVGDIADFELCQRVLRGADLLIHVAAESHVDNSFGNSLLFTRTNALGTHTIMEASRVNSVPRIVHISTDEVYGEILAGACDETAPLRPTNPYSASKAAAEMIVRGYVHSFQMPIVTVRANNIYGIRQYPEKIIPRFCVHLAEGRRLPIHGDGTHERHYLAAVDFVAAVGLLIDRGQPGDVYNVGSGESYSNLDVARMICGVFGVEPQEAIEFVPDRPFNDHRYAVDWRRIGAMGWRPRKSLKQDLPGIAAWYRDNLDRFREL